MTGTFTLAHFSDIHLEPDPGFHPRYWNVKRALGWLNWHRGRKNVHMRDVADRLIADALRLRADHIVVTGDLLTLGLPAEYERAFAWLKNIGPPSMVTVVPGNHDIYSSLKGDRGVARWADYMGGNIETHAFPFVRRIGPLALVGLNSAEETPPFVAAGRLGPHQIEVASQMLQSMGDEGVVRVLLIHHPPLPGLADHRRALRDAAHLSRAIEKNGAELVLYGHNHRERLDWLGGAGRAIPVVGASSSSAARAHRNEPLARYNLFTFFTGGGRVRIRHTVRGLQSLKGSIVQLSETVLTPENPAGA